MPAGSMSRASRVSRPVTDMPTMGVPIRPVTPDDVVTIGVAIEVPDPHGAELQRWRADFGDPLANAIPAHVTLLPPTVVPPSMTPDVAAHLAEVAARTKPFVVRLRGTGSFRPVSPVVYVRVYAHRCASRCRFASVLSTAISVGCAAWIISHISLLSRRRERECKH